MENGALQYGQGLSVKPFSVHTGGSILPNFMGCVIRRIKNSKPEIVWNRILQRSRENSSIQCLPCPPGHVRVDPFASDSSTCRPCGPGLITKNGYDCITDCTVQKGDYVYDLTPLKGFHTVRGSSLFTASGTQYFRNFNISLCMDSFAVCEKNVSLQHGIDSISKVESLVCQSTIFPPAALAPPPSLEQETGGFDAYADVLSRPLSTHASSLGDHLIGISGSPSILGVPIAEDIKAQLQHPHQLHFFYSTPERTIACPHGRSTTLTFRCKPPSSWNLLDNGSITSPDANSLRTLEGCPDGTCDGCNFHFIWETPLACHLCLENELTVVKGECKDGMQDVHYLPTQTSQCLLRINSTWPTSQKCQAHLPFLWQVAIQVAGGLAVVFASILVCFWRRHRKLEYKYMKLVASGSSRNNHTMDHDKDPQLSERDMMPVAESCALDPNDESEEEDIYDRERPSGSSRLNSQMQEVRFHSDGAIKNLVSKVHLFDKLKSLTRKGETGSTQEIMNLTDKEACS